MIPSVEALDRLATAWASSIWAVTWQAALVVIAFALIARGMKRSPPALRYWLWQVAAIKLLLMPLWGIPVILPMMTSPSNGAGSETPSSARAVGLGETPGDRLAILGPDAIAEAEQEIQRGWEPEAPAIDWRAWLLIGWGLAVIVQAGAIVRQHKRLQRLLRRAIPAADPGLLSLVAATSARLGLARPPRVLITNEDGSPFVCGPRRPTLVLPCGLAEGLDPDALRSVLAHELAHIKRRDLIWDWIPTIARLLYFFHPAAHFIADRARLERELACDQAAMALSGRGVADYASTLVEIASRSATPAIAAEIPVPLSPLSEE